MVVRTDASDAQPDEQVVALPSPRLWLLGCPSRSPHGAMGCNNSKPSASVAPAAATKMLAPGAASEQVTEPPALMIETKMSLDFGKVMDESEGMAAMLKFAQSEFAEEVILFWMEVMRFKRYLAEEQLWKVGGVGRATTASVAPQPTGSSALFSDPFGGPPDPFGGPDDDDDPFGETHGAGGGGGGSGAALMSSEPPPEAASGDRAGYLKRKFEHIIDTYLANGAEFQVTFADHKYKDTCGKANGGNGSAPLSRLSTDPEVAPPLPTGVP
jgi:hypothetical protein